MTRRLVTLALCLPGLGAAVHWLLEHPDRSRAPAIAAATFGGFAVLVVLFAVVLPAGMRRFDQSDRADAWRRAAVAALPPAVFFTFVWSFLFLPNLHPTELVVLGLAGVICMTLAIWWERRVTHRGGGRDEPTTSHGRGGDRTA